MSNRQQMSPTAAYEIGYGKPPATPVSLRGSRKPARATAGRAARSAHALFLEELNRLLTVRQGGKV